MGVNSGVVGTAGGDGDAGGRGSCKEQPEEIRGRTANMKVIHSLLNIDNPPKGLNQEPGCSKDFAAAQLWFIQHAA